VTPATSGERPWYEPAIGDPVVTCGHSVRDRCWAVDLAGKPVIVENELTGEVRQVSIGFLCTRCVGNEYFALPEVVVWDGQPLTTIVDA